MKKPTYRLSAKLFKYPGMQGAWYFLTVDKKTSTTIKEKFAPKTRGFGSIRVSVTTGDTSWKTSIFPDKKSGTYLLPVKAKVRQTEDLYPGDTVKFSITIA